MPSTCPLLWYEAGVGGYQQHVFAAQMMRWHVGLLLWRALKLNEMKMEDLRACVAMRRSVCM